MVVVIVRDGVKEVKRDDGPYVRYKHWELLQELGVGNTPLSLRVE